MGSARKTTKHVKALAALGLITAMSARAYGQRANTPSNSGSSPAIPLKSADKKIDFAHANPEDITNENFPNLIESFDYPNADISEIVIAISKLTGKNFILDKNVSGKISIIAPSQITVAEAYKAFLTALAMNGYTVVPSGNFLKIRSLQNASSEAIDTYAGAYFPTSDQLITRIVKLKYINAEEVQKTFRPLINKQGDITPYAPTNSVIITDFGSNVERITNILNQLDVPGFEEKLVVIPIRYARAKDISDLVDQIINKGEKSSSNRFTPGIPRFRSNNNNNTSSSSGAASYSLVIPDSRTNSIIVVGNQAGIERIRGLVAKLDFKLRPEDEGGVYVYYVRHGDAEKISNVLNGIATESQKSATQTTSPTNAPPGLGGGNPLAAQSQAVFGGDVKVAADKDNNSLLITASKQDYDVVRNILAKIDIPRDQVFVKTIIMEMNASDSTTWGIDYYKFAEGTNGVGRAGFRSSGVSDLIDPTNDRGLILGWGKDDLVKAKINNTEIEVPSLLALVKFLKSQTGANILSTPQITALDNEEAEIVVGQNVPVSASSQSTAAGTTTSIDRRDIELKMTLTPYISPDTDSVRMKIEQKVENLLNTNVAASKLAEQAISFAKRSIKTNVIVSSNDTAVLGGLMQDSDSEQVVKVPVLGDIPILGWLFKGKSTDKTKSNLVVFITPTILRNSQDSDDLLNKKLNERIDFIQQNMKGRDPHGFEIDSLPRKQLSENETEEFINVPAGDVPTDVGPVFEQPQGAAPLDPVPQSETIPQNPEDIR